VQAAGTHEQVWIKVNAQVDRGVAGVVAALNCLNGLRTIASCEGVSGEKPAYVYFNYGDWRKVGQLCFEVIGPPLWGRLKSSVTISFEIFNESEPMAKLAFDKEATNVVASVLAELTTNDHS
jgi:hypothetical protein